MMNEKKVDINIVSNSLGKKHLQIIAPNPVITTQPTDRYSPTLVTLLPLILMQQMQTHINGILLMKMAEKLTGSIY